MGCFAFRDIVRRRPLVTAVSPPPLLGGAFSVLPGSFTIARRPVSSNPVITGNTAGYAISNFRPGLATNISTKLYTSKSRSKSILATSTPNKSAKQMVQIPGVFHHVFSLFFKIVKPPVFSPNFLTYCGPFATSRRARIFEASTTTRESVSARRYKSHCHMLENINSSNTKILPCP